jgi:hypothetical protein
MTSHVGRLYAAAIAIVVLFLSWAAIAARPWASAALPAQDPRVQALQARELRLRAESIRVQKIVQHRWAVYRTEVARRRKLAAQPAVVQTPAVRVVTLPPLTVTRSS